MIHSRSPRHCDNKSNIHISGGNCFRGWRDPNFESPARFQVMTSPYRLGNRILRLGKILISRKILHLMRTPPTLDAIESTDVNPENARDAAATHEATKVLQLTGSTARLRLAYISRQNPL